MQEGLGTKLDTLLERYLGLLDKYQQAREQFAKDLSDGYLFLARANSSSAGRVRYGQDYYDERMQASRKLRVTEDETNKGTMVTVEDVAAASAVNSTNEEAAETKSQEENVKTTMPSRKQKPASKQIGGMTVGPAEVSDTENELEKAFIALQLSKAKAIPSSSRDQLKSDVAGQNMSEGPENENANMENNKISDKLKHNDPIQMFGFFVPTTLRQAQASFVEAVVKGVPALVELDSEMNLLEIEIRRTRKAIAKESR